MWGMIYSYARVSTEAQDLTGATAQLKPPGAPPTADDVIPIAP
jgi:hypothetical protein